MSEKRRARNAPPRSADLAELIRTRRLALTDSAGRPPSQERMADEIGQTINTYNELENGVERHREPRTLDTIALKLRMSAGERRALYVISNKHEPEAVPGSAPPDCVDDHKSIIDPMPHHAYITDRQWNVLAVNDAVRRDVPGFEEGVNVFEWILGRPESRETLVNWYDVWAVRTLRCLKTHAAVYGDLYLVSLYKKLRSCVERSDDVIGYFDPSGEIRSFVTSKGTTLTFRYQIYRLAADQPSQYRIVNLIPATDSVLPASDDSARHRARQLDRELRGGTWRIPERG